MQRVVLVIDDDEKLRSFVATALEAVGFKTFCAETSQEGLSLAFMNPPDLVLCDVILPDALGFETARALNDHPATSEVPVVLMTGYPYMRSHGASAQWRLLSKPFAMNNMLDTVAKVLRNAVGHGQAAKN
jgi:DNA-binding response OmpR family regulator